MKIPPSSSTSLSNQHTFHWQNQEGQLKENNTSKISSINFNELEFLELNEKKVMAGIKTFNDIFKPTHLEFQLHDESGKYFVKIVDDKTQEVIKQIPSEDFLKMVAEAREQMGIFLDKRV
jgi:flagellar protein FlaG